jgi:hypothetical protein
VAIRHATEIATALAAVIGAVSLALRQRYRAIQGAA